jgi:hypothetical protein
MHVDMCAAVPGYARHFVMIRKPTLKAFALTDIERYPITQRRLLCKHVVARQIPEIIPDWVDVVFISLSRGSIPVNCLLGQ